MSDQMVVLCLTIAAAAVGYVIGWNDGKARGYLNGYRDGHEDAGYMNRDNR